MVQKAQELLTGGQYNATPTTLADGQQSISQMDNKGNLKVSTQGGSGPAGSTPVSGAASTTMTPNQVAMTASAAQILAANTNREGASIINVGASTIYLGQTSGVTATTGFPLPPNTAYNIDIPLYTGAVFGICAATLTSTAGVVELTP